MHEDEMIEKQGSFKYGVLCALEQCPPRYPVALNGDIGYVTGKAAMAGAEAIELHIRDPYKYDPKELTAAAKGHGLSFAAITTGLESVLNGLTLINDDIGIRRLAVEKLKGHLDLAEKIGCPAVVIGVMRGNIPDFDRFDEYEGRLTEAMLELSDHAKGRGVALLIEGINRYVTNYLCSIPEVLAYIKKLNRQNIMIHIDTHQMNIEDVDFAKAIGSCRGQLGYVHFSDNNRALPGGGNIDFFTIMKALRDIRYDGYIGIESAVCLPGDPALKNCIEDLRMMEKRL